MLRIIARNIVSNWAGYAVNAIVIFFLTPFVLRSLGDTRYGIWILVNGLTGYFGLLNLGLSGGTTQYLTRHLAQRDHAAMNRAASASVVGLSACGLVVVAAAGLVSWLAPAILTIPKTAIHEVRLCIAVLGITTAAQFGFFPYHAVFTALQRFDLANAISIPLRLASAAATYVALQLGYGLVGLCVVNAACDLLGCLIRLKVAYRILPELHVSPRLAAWSDFRPILSYGMVNSLNDGAVIIKQYSSSLIIGLFMPLAALTPFNLAAGLVTQIDRLFGPVAMVFFPVATQLDAQGDRDKLRRMYFVVSRMFLCAGVAVAIIGSIWAGDFYRLWVGARYVEGNEYVSVVVLFWVLMAAETIRIGQKIGHQVFLGCRAMRILTFVTVVEAVGTLVLLIPLILLFGLLGVVLATLIPVMLVVGLLVPVAVCRVIQSRPSEYYLAAYPRPFFLALSLTPPLLLLHQALPVQDSWFLLGLCGVLAGVTAVILLLWIGLNRNERRQVLVQVRRRIAAWRYGQKSVDAQACSSSAESL